MLPQSRGEGCWSPSRRGHLWPLDKRPLIFILGSNKVEDGGEGGAAGFLDWPRIALLTLQRLCDPAAGPGG